MWLQVQVSTSETQAKEQRVLVYCIFAQCKPSYKHITSAGKEEKLVVVLSKKMVNSRKVAQRKYLKISPFQM